MKMNRSFSALSARPLDVQASYFLAGGETLRKLESAHEGYMAQHRILGEIKHDLDAVHVGVRVQRYGGLARHFDRPLHHFDIKFKEGDVPQGWTQTQAIDGARLWMPPQRSSAYDYLSRQRVQLGHIYAAFGRPANDVPQRYESRTQRGALVEGTDLEYLKVTGNACRNYTDGWRSWQRDAFISNEACRLFTNEPITHRVAGGVYVISIVDPEQTPAGSIPISIFEARMLESDPAKAPARAQVIQDGSVLGRGLQQLPFVLR